MDAQIPVGQLEGGRRAGKPQHRQLYLGGQACQLGGPGRSLCPPAPDLGRACARSQWGAPEGEQLGRVPCGEEQGSLAPQLCWESWGLSGDTLGPWNPSPSPPVLSEARKGRGWVPWWRRGRAADQGLGDSCPLDPLGGWGEVVCVYTSRTAKEELGRGLGLSHLPPVYSVHCLQGWEWCCGLGGRAEPPHPQVVGRGHPPPESLGKPLTLCRRSLPSPTAPGRVYTLCSAWVCLPSWLELLRGGDRWPVSPTPSMGPGPGAPTGVCGLKD